MAVTPITHLEKTIAGSVQPVTHLEKVIVQTGGGGGSVTIDNIPTEGSPNAVSSGGVYDSLREKADSDSLNGFLTEDDLSDYATHDDVDDAITEAIGDITRFEYYLCGEGEYDPDTGVPTVQNPDSNHIYLVPTSGDNLNMYAYINSAFTFLGTTEIDLSDYVTEQELAEATDNSITVTGRFASSSQNKVVENLNMTATEIVAAYNEHKTVKAKFGNVVMGSYAEFVLVQAYHWTAETLGEHDADVAVFYTALQYTVETGVVIIVTVETSEGVTSGRYLSLTIPRADQTVPASEYLQDSAIPVAYRGRWRSENFYSMMENKYTQSADIASDINSDDTVVTPKAMKTWVDSQSFETQSAATTALAGKADANHNHDSRYYTESEVDTALAGKANASHTHTKSQITDFPSNVILGKVNGTNTQLSINVIDSGTPASGTPNTTITVVKG